MDIKPITRRIGAEVLGVDLSVPLSPAAREAIGDALLLHQVLFFRDQDLTPHQLKEFGRAFGELTVHPAVDGPPGHPEVMVVRSDETSKWVAGERWHADLTCNPKPPMGSILYLQTVPGVGGDTVFSNMCAAYDALPDELKETIADLTAVHDGNPLFRSVFPDAERTYPVSTHPVVCIHPDTRKKVLYVNPEYTKRVNGVEPSQGERLLQKLFWHYCANPNFQVRFRWTPNTVAFWDNRCTQHLAVWDYFPDTRVGMRIQVTGSEPLSA